MIAGAPPANERPGKHKSGKHWEPGSNALQDAARARLESLGVQWTELRANLFTALARDGRPVSAYDVADRLSAATGRRVAANSVYRILDLFVESGLAKRIESRNAYMANSHPSCAHDCIFLICEACGHIDHLDDDRLAGEMRAKAGMAGFAPRRPVLELLGQCRTCQQADAAASAHQPGAHA